MIRISTPQIRGRLPDDVRCKASVNLSGLFVFGVQTWYISGPKLNFPKE